MRTLELQRIADLTREVGEDRIVGFDVDPQGQPLFTIEGGVVDPPQDPNSPFFPVSRADQPHRVRVFWERDSGRRTLELAAEHFHFHFAQPLGDERMLLVCARARRFKDGSAENNARVFGPRGELLHEWRFRDGINHVQVGADGKIWVGYFDEGVFGNFGWGQGKGTEPIGASGLLAFDAHTGERVFEFDPASVNAGPVDDLYALNVGADATWAYYYSDFPLVRVQNGRANQAWKMPVAGSSAVAIAGELALLYGSYDKDGAMLVRFSEGGGVQKLGPVKVELPFDEAVEQVRARGPYLLARSGARVFRGDLRTLGL